MSAETDPRRRLEPPDPCQIDGVLFDFAGTLFMPADAPEWVRRVAFRLGLELDDLQVERLAGGYLEAGLPGAPYPASIPDHLAAAYAERDLRADAHRTAYVSLLRMVEEPCPGFAEEMYAEISHPEHWMPYADTHDVVAALADAGVAVGLVSNVGFDLRPILRAHDLGLLADRCTLSYEHGSAKPDPRLFEAALATIGTSPARTLMVGDHPAADGGAAAVGCHTLLLPMSAAGSRHGLDRVLELVG